MKQDRYNPSIYWHGGKMYFTGGSMPLMQGAMGGESVQSSMPGIMNTPVAGLQPSSGVGSNNPSSPNGGINNAGLAGAAGLGGVAVDMIAKPGSKGAGIGGGAMKGAAMGSALGPYGMAAGAVIGGVAGLVGANKAQQEESMLTEQQSRDAYAAGTINRNPAGSVYAANGGAINFANGGITPRLTTFGAGGTHEQNTDGGVQQGINEDGQPNLVEQGETKFKDYIFSDRLTMPNAREYNLGGHLNGQTFASISKKLSKSIDERPNDPIAKLGQDKALERLKMANDDAIEMKKFEDENQSYKCGGGMKVAKGRKFEYGGYTFNDI